TAVDERSDGEEGGPGRWSRRLSRLACSVEEFPLSGPDADMTGPIAEFNLGWLRHDWDDPRVADFVNGLDTVNAIAARSPGFIWMTPEDEMERAQLSPDGPFGGDDRVASTLSVWRSVADLRHFVTNTLHAAYMKRGGEWLHSSDTPRFVMWPVAAEARPNVAEGLERLQSLTKHGPGPDAFDWQWAKDNV
ncbi:MAG: DUF3291 domain-containing protein, partial [Pseudomonadota bacterium]